MNLFRLTEDTLDELIAKRFMYEIDVRKLLDSSATEEDLEFHMPFTAFSHKLADFNIHSLFTKEGKETVVAMYSARKELSPVITNLSALFWLRINSYTKYKNYTEYIVNSFVPNHLNLRAMDKDYRQSLIRIVPDEKVLFSSNTPELVDDGPYFFCLVYRLFITSLTKVNHLAHAAYEGYL